MLSRKEYLSRGVLLVLIVILACPSFSFAETRTGSETFRWEFDTGTDTPHYEVTSLISLTNGMRVTYASTTGGVENEISSGATVCSGGTVIVRPNSIAAGADYRWGSTSGGFTAYTQVPGVADVSGIIVAASVQNILWLGTSSFLDVMTTQPNRLGVNEEYPYGIGSSAVLQPAKYIFYDFSAGGAVTEDDSAKVNVVCGGNAVVYRTDSGSDVEVGRYDLGSSTEPLYKIENIATGTYSLRSDIALTGCLGFIEAHDSAGQKQQYLYRNRQNGMDLTTPLRSDVVTITATASPVGPILEKDGTVTISNTYTDGSGTLIVESGIWDSEKTADASSLVAVSFSVKNNGDMNAKIDKANLKLYSLPEANYASATFSAPSIADPSADWIVAPGATLTIIASFNAPMPPAGGDAFDMNASVPYASEAFDSCSGGYLSKGSPANVTLGKLKTQSFEPDDARISVSVSPSEVDEGKPTLVRACGTVEAYISGLWRGYSANVIVAVYDGNHAWRGETSAVAGSDGTFCTDLENPFLVSGDPKLISKLTDGVYEINASIVLPFPRSTSDALTVKATPYCIVYTEPDAVDEKINKITIEYRAFKKSTPSSVYVKLDCGEGSGYKTLSELGSAPEFMCAGTEDGNCYGVCDYTEALNADPNVNEFSASVEIPETLPPGVGTKIIKCSSPAGACKAYE
ncbi:MAG: hypothetical protein ABIH99_00250 [Candidatus Micrarchaeota archaeon]